MVFRIQWLVIGAASEHDKEGFPALGIWLLEDIHTNTKILRFSQGLHPWPHLSLGYNPSGTGCIVIRSLVTD